MPSGNESDNEYVKDDVLVGRPNYSEGKYLIVTVTNFGQRTIRFAHVQTSAGRVVAIPKEGSVIQSSDGNGNMARLVFKQLETIPPHGPKVNITCKGKNGIFKLYAQQNYCFLAAGDITAYGKYEGFGEGEVQFTKTEGGFNQGNGLVEFRVREIFKREFRSVACDATQNQYDHTLVHILIFFIIMGVEMFYVLLNIK